MKSGSYFLIPPTAPWSLGIQNYRNAVMQYHKHLLSARKSTLLHKALKKIKSYKFWGCERSLFPDSPCPLPVCLCALSGDYFSRLESGRRVRVSRHLLVWVPEISSSADFPISTPSYVTTTPGHHAARKLHLIPWIPLNWHFQLLDFAVALSVRL